MHNEENQEMTSPSDQACSFFVPDEETRSLDQHPPAQKIGHNKELNSELAKEMNELSMADRDELLRDIHGVNDHIEETPEFVAQKLVELEKALKQIRNKDAYDLAQSKSPEYVSEGNFRLLFLRADRFAPYKAAVRMVRHFETKLELFGPGKIARDIEMDDLEEDGIACLESGFTQTLPVRDSSGRSISCWIPELRPRDCSIEARMRACFYGGMIALWDEETQKKGIVIIVYLFGERTTEFDPNGAWKLPALSGCMPIRVASCHVCMNDSKLSPLIALGLMVTGSYTRLRHRYHRGTFEITGFYCLGCGHSSYLFSHQPLSSIMLVFCNTGTPQECFYQLLTFGIPGHALPFTKDGELLEKTKDKWELVRRQEKNVPKDKRVKVPASFDVLLGRGKPLQDNPGNVRYRHFIEQNSERYTTASRHLKTVIAEHLLDAVQARDGRFLKLGDNGWTEADDKEARAKISHSFRSLRSAILSKEMDKSKTKPEDKSRPAVSHARPELENKEVDTHISSAKRMKPQSDLFSL
jgi:hypothetical protein